MQDFQQRVVDEKAALDEKLEKLCLFCYRAKTFESLPIMEQERLNQQRHVMTVYSAILGARIAAFEQGNDNNTPPGSVASMIWALGHHHH